MKLNKIVLGATLALGLAAFGQTEDVQAAEWSARTVEEVKADFETVSDSKTYTIQFGDTLGTIAKAADVEVSTLVEINNIKNADVIFPGNKLSFKTNNEGEVEEVTVEDTAAATVETYSVEETTTAPPVVTETTPTTDYVEEEVATAPVVEAAPAQPVATSTNSSSAKSEIARRESTNNYNARNGQYIGKYQLTDSYLNGDYSPANQERVADDYVSDRYGSWDAALSFHNANGWY